MARAMTSHDDTALTYLYGRLDVARRMMAEDQAAFEQRRDWAMRAEELRQCVRKLEQWRVEKVGARYMHDDATATEIRPPRPARSQ